MTVHTRSFIRGLAIASLLLAAGAALAAESTAEVLAKLHQSNQKEIAAGKLAQKSGKSAKVKDYGKLLVKDHGEADKKVLALAREEKIDLPAPAAPSHDMSAMAGDADFDLKFAQDMVADHKKDIEEVSTARDTTTDPKLKKLLTGLVPTLQKHLEVAQQIVDTSQKPSAQR
jgi:putative membrane protein